MEAIQDAVENRNLGERQIPLDDESEEEEEQESSNDIVDSYVGRGTEISYHIESDGNAGVERHVSKRIVDGKKFLPDEIRGEHNDQIAREGSPSRAEVSDDWHQNDVKHNGNEYPEHGEPGAEVSPVCQFVPK